MSEKITVVTGADENYAIGLLVAVRSMMTHIDRSCSVELYVLDGGIASETKQKILDSWKYDQLNINWLSADMSSLRELKTDGYLNHSTYLRLLIPAILPADCDKAFYLDSDLLIRKDISQLWRSDINDVAILAGQETSSPYVDSEVVFNDEPLKYSKLGTNTPVRNYRELGMDPKKKIFNAGILLINVAYWRKESISQQVQTCLQENHDDVLFCDQYGLNVVLKDSWREFDTRWNQTASVYDYQFVEESPFSAAEYQALKTDPWICHFTYIHKPWFRDCDHPYTDEYLSHLGGTPFEHDELPVNEAAQALAIKPGEQKKRTWRQWAAKRKYKIKRAARKLGLPISDDLKKAA